MIGNKTSWQHFEEQTFTWENYWCTKPSADTFELIS